MTYLIAAAGTGGHVFPGLSVGEALLDLGVARSDVRYVGGDRLEAKVYPREGFAFTQLELAGLQRSMTLENFRLPLVLFRARNRIAELIESSGVKVVLGMGGYVTIPAALAARKRHVFFFNAEQNAEAGLANRVTARWAEETFVAFPDTAGIATGTWVGNPVRRVFWSFDRTALRAGGALERYDLDPDVPVVGVFGGSLGAGVINDAVADMLEGWSGRPIQFIHLAGEAHEVAIGSRSPAPGVTWRRIGFEERMECFYAACDVIIARAGGAVAELTATGTPSILVPGRFGSGGHQEENARFLSTAGAAEVIEEERLADLAAIVSKLVEDPELTTAMARATRYISKPDAARTIARKMIEAAE